jgi:hypothetical protein
MSTRAITRTVRIASRACGIIADMARLVTGLAAWLGGTAAAVFLAWLGAGLVVRNTTSPADPAVPVISLAPSARATAPPSAGLRPPPRTTSHPAAPAAASPSSTPAVPSPTGTPSSYTLVGGQVTLVLTGDSASLVTAVPEAGFAVQTWSGPDWLRVDFSSGTQVSSLIASWNGHPPSVVVTN